jgi:hypothetical protein
LKQQKPYDYKIQTPKHYLKSTSQRKAKTQKKTTTTKTPNNKDDYKPVFQRPNNLNQGIHHQTTSPPGKPPPQKTNHKTSTKPPTESKKALKNKPTLP